MSERTLLVAVLLLFAAVAGGILLYLGGGEESVDIADDSPTRSSKAGETGDGAPLDAAIDGPDSGSIGEIPEERGSYTIETVGPRWARGSFRGRVVTERGDPVRDAPILLFRAATGIFVQEKSYTGINTRTDGSGTYVLDGVPAGTVEGSEETRPAFPTGGTGFVIRCTAAGAAPAEVECPPVEAGGIVAVADLVVRAGYTLRGAVTDGQGAPLSGAIVKAVDPLEEQSGLPAELRKPPGATTDASGRYAIPFLGPRQYDVTASFAGYMPSTRSVLFGFLGQEGDSADLEFALERGLHGLRGRVVTQSGKALPGARVAIHAVESGSGGGFSRTLRADAKGRFHCDGLSKIRCALQADAKGHYLAAPVIASSESDEEILLRLDAKGKISGRIAPPDGSGGRLPDRFSIAVETFHPDLMAGVPGERKDANFSGKGTFVLDDLFPGTYVLSARVAGYSWTSSDRITVEKGKTTERITIVLARGGAIAGRLCGRGGKAAQGFNIRLRHQHYQPGFLFSEPAGSEAEQGKAALSGKDGRFILEAIRPGTYCLEIEGAGMAIKLLRDIVVSEGKRIDAGTVTITAGGRLRGTACDRDGRPAGGVAVMALNRQSGFCKTAVTDNAGAFTIDALEAGSYTVCMKNTSWAGLGLRSDVTVQVLEAGTAFVALRPREPETQR